MKIAIATAFAFLAIVSTTAHAQEVVQSQADVAASPFAGAALIDNGALGAITGQADVAQVVNARNTSEVSHNVVGANSVTGTISFDGSSFADLRGLSVLSANTGNNVSINASLNVNVAVHP